jgi:hypothetical protein
MSMPPISLHPARSSLSRHLRVGVVVASAVATFAAADEGMWLFNEPPLARLEADHGVRLDAEWLGTLQHAAVRFSSGGSGAFVSAEGLVLTNHHVAADAFQKLGDASRDIYRDGFQAVTRGDEIPCPDLELNVLVSIEDVTERVESAVAGMANEEAFSARRRRMAEIEQESLTATGFRSDVVTLFSGGGYHLYRFKRYTDVRLVFAPERQIAFFGGDADNFEYPRHDLDICFLRAYEDGRPADTPHYLRWAERPVQQGDVVFVAGHPGHTDRGLTIVELLALRDRRLPFMLDQLHRREVLLTAYSEEGPEARQQAAHELFGVQNSRKARAGLLAGLLDPRIIASRQAEEDSARRTWEQAHAGGVSPWHRIEAAQRTIDAVAERHAFLELGLGFDSEFFSHARSLLRAAEEAAKPSGQRLREYRDSNRASLERTLFSEAPLHDAFEEIRLADSLTFLVGRLGSDDPLVSSVLAGLSPRDRAAELVRGTALGRRPSRPDRPDRPDLRRSLYEGGLRAVIDAGDPMIELARLVDPEARRLRAIVDEAGEVKRQAYAEITRERRAVLGADLYPDATFTLRLAYGVVRGYDDRGVRLPFHTTYADLLDRTDRLQGLPPFDLPPRWQRLRGRLEEDRAFLDTPLNVVSTADIIGGNSGSPVVSRQGDLVGVIFDGNSDSLVLGVAYDDVRARAIAVDAGGILAALDRVYEAGPLVAELLGGRTTSVVAEDGGDWRPLFDGRGLGGWEATDFGGEGDVTVADQAIRIAMGSDLSGITWNEAFPRQSYEIAVEAERTDGSDFFCGLTFPVGDECCSLILGGWGGGLVGLSCIDGNDAANNDTTQYHEFENGRWYAVRVRVTPERITCFLDGRQIIDQPLADHTISVRAEVIPSQPLGIATYATTARVKNIRWRPVELAPDAKAAPPSADAADAAGDAPPPTP